MGSIGCAADRESIAASRIEQTWVRPGDERIRGGAKGHVRVHANVSAVVQFLPEDLAEFVARHDEIKIHLVDTVSTEVIRAVQEGDADIGICHPNLPIGNLQVRPYRRDRLLMVVRRGHSLQPVPPTPCPAGLPIAGQGKGSPVDTLQI